MIYIAIEFVLVLGALAGLAFLTFGLDWTWATPFAVLFGCSLIAVWGLFRLWRSQ